jgi:hypothetical protein
VDQRIPAGGGEAQGAATYALKRTFGEGEHREHRGHRAEDQRLDGPDAPYAEGH